MQICTRILSEKGHDKTAGLKPLYEIFWPAKIVGLVTGQYYHAHRGTVTALTAAWCFFLLIIVGLATIFFTVCPLLKQSASKRVSYEVDFALQMHTFELNPLTCSAVISTTWYILFTYRTVTENCALITQ